MTTVGEERAIRVSTSSVTTTSTLGPNIAPRTQPSLEHRKLWERRYARRIRWTDGVIVITVVMATAVGQLLAFAPSVLAQDPLTLARVPVLTIAVWLTMLAVFHTRAADIMGSGPAEYKRLAHASGFAFGVLAIAFVIFQWEGLRSQLILALPAGVAALLVGRWTWRKWLLGQRRFGHYASRAIVVGTRDDVEYVIGRLQRDGQQGYIVVGTVIEDADVDRIQVGGVPFDVVGDLDEVAQVARKVRADSIVVASRPASDPDYIKRLSWQLEGTAAELILSSRLADVAGPRMSLRPVDGLPLIAVRIPSFEGGAHLFKRGMDIVLSSLALLALTPLMPIIAIAIAIDSRGPVFFRQVRIGRDGREFQMLKFRTMAVDAEERLAALLAANEGAGPLFKMKHDPRITRVGRILRKYSIDELPQFWNVFIGDMSIVGPRPPLPREVVAYDGAVSRRLYINPGITGLWQISGRSDLSWEESVNLDLRYVENWSLTSDLMIMWRTAKVMVSPSGAY